MPNVCQGMDKATLYRSRADEFIAKGQRAHPKLKATFEAIAESFLVLAEKAEQVEHDPGVAPPLQPND